MPFEYDLSKSRSNLLKHGIDFEAAQALWLDRQMIQAPARTTDEPRFLVVGKIADKHWAADCVSRGTAIRIISVRRAREEEIERYEGD